MIKALSLSAIAVTAILVGCGGGGSSSTTGGSNPPVAKNGGIFVDSPVKGLSYACQTSGTSGKTDATGRYDCAVGDTTVAFAIGTRNIGTTLIAPVITPRSFFNGTGRDDEILNLAQLLQTMDKDGNPDNGIELDETAIVNWQSNHTGFDNATFDTLVSNELGKTLVSESTAKKHFNDTLSSMGLDGIFSSSSSSVSLSSSSSSISSSSSSSSVSSSSVSSSSVSSSSVSSSQSSSSSSTGSSNSPKSLLINNATDVRGYRLSSVTVKSASGTDTIVVEIACDGKFKQEWTQANDGMDSSVKTIKGNDIYLEHVMGLSETPAARLRWSGLDKYGQTADGNIYLGGDNTRLKEGQSCFTDLDCIDHAYFLKSIEKIETCR
jgi:hypothetical protein